MNYLKQIAALAQGREFAIFNGHEMYFYESLELGARGIISSSANVFPAQANALYNAFLAADSRVKEDCYPIFEAMHDFKSKHNDNTFGIYLLKSLLHRKNICTPAVAMPYFYCSEQDRAIETFCHNLHD